MTQKQKGILFITLSSFFFALMNLFVRLSGDLPAMQKSFFRNFVALIFAAFILWRERPQVSFTPKSKRHLFFRALAGTIGVLCNFYSVDHLVLADASMLNKMSPFFAVIFAIFLLKEKPSRFQAMSIVIAFIGVLFIVKPTGNMQLFPAFIGLMGGLTAGLAYTYVRSLGQQGVTGPFIVFFFSAFSCVVLLPFLIFDFHPMTWTQLGTLLLAGLSAAGGQFTITAAYCYAPAREISVYDYFQIPFSALLGFLVFGQLPDALSWLGYVIICGTAVAMFLHTTKKTAPTPE